jgi:hypothetical protein
LTPRDSSGSRARDRNTLQRSADQLRQRDFVVHTGPRPLDRSSCFVSSVPCGCQRFTRVPEHRLWQMPVVHAGARDRARHLRHRGPVCTSRHSSPVAIPAGGALAVAPAPRAAARSRSPWRPASGALAVALAPRASSALAVALAPGWQCARGRPWGAPRQRGRLNVDANAQRNRQKGDLRLDPFASPSPDTTGSSGTEGIPAGFDPAPSTRESCRASTTIGFLSRDCPGFVRIPDRPVRRQDTPDTQRRDLDGMRRRDACWRPPPS